MCEHKGINTLSRVLYSHDIADSSYQVCKEECSSVSYPHDIEGRVASKTLNYLRKSAQRVNGRVRILGSLASKPIPLPTPQDTFNSVESFMAPNLTQWSVVFLQAHLNICW